MDSALHLWESHFFGLPSQSNIYGLSKLRTANRSTLLVATLRRQVFTIEYHRSPGLLLPASKEVPFTYIPGDANIISIDAFNKSEHSNDFVVGITFIKNAENQVNHQYFNIYFDWDPGSEFSLDTIAQSCMSVQLPFIPYQLYHTKLFSEDGEEVVWLLSGSDCQLHLYREDKVVHKYVEQSVVEFFPEFEKIPRNVHTLNIVNYPEQEKRVSVFGCEDGYVCMSIVDTVKKEVINSWNISHDGSITSVNLFSSKSYVELPHFLQQGVGITKEDRSSFQKDQKFSPEIGDLHLLVTSALEKAVVYENVLEEGFDKQLLLPESDGYDCVTCSYVTDIDMDGYNEILVGTYGQELLVYKNVSQLVLPTLSPTESTDSVLEGFQIIWRRSFSSPIHSLNYVDITGDGLQELIVLALKGVHILQHSLQEAAELCKTRLQELVEKGWTITQDQEKT